MQNQEYESLKKTLHDLNLKYEQDQELIHATEKELSRLADRTEQMRETKQNLVSNNLPIMITNARDTIARLRAEVQSLEVQIALVQHALLRNYLAPT